MGVHLAKHPKKTREKKKNNNNNNMTDPEKKDASKKKRGKPNKKTGLIGVYKKREKYQADITVDGTRHNLGSFDTKEQAGVAYDRFAVDKSTDEVSFTLNYPKMSDLEREEALKVEPPLLKKRKRGNPNQETTGLIGVNKSTTTYE
tara:strand:- start:644 stop:1081 length:438 start_codon:yes stop_codon:yes gene_type:complete